MRFPVLLSHIFGRDIVGLIMMLLSIDTRRLKHTNISIIEFENSIDNNIVYDEGIYYLCENGCWSLTTHRMFKYGYLGKLDPEYVGIIWNNNRSIRNKRFSLKNI